MKSRYLLRNRTDGFATVETAICCFVVMFLFALFLTITGYCRTYLTVKEYISEKARDTAVARYMLGFDVPGIITANDFDNVRNRRIKNFIIYSESWGEEVKLNASYTYISMLGDIRVRMGSFFTKWAGDSHEKGNSVWELPPVQRGKVLESLFGGSLPEFFPVLDAYDQVSGHAASIVSIDTTLDLYSDGCELKKTIIEKADELSAYKFGKYEDVLITDKDIDTRELIIVIPENQLNDNQFMKLEECMDYTSENSIILTVKRYQYIQNTVSGQEPD